MAPGDTTQGQRVHGKPTHELLPGEYGAVNTPDGPRWRACTPSGDYGNLEHGVWREV
jgi:hypothetical protein